ncbi:uncharacterized protein LOC142336079 isoform X3 [Convolutriloba macropyga]|uniref:uncharacterized protein LOC142336079 isoform X3 n=1 Tax=Convolutriloba macropyga TaxID=536237 RepID=UPI003F51CF1D
MSSAGRGKNSNTVSPGQQKSSLTQSQGKGYADSSHEARCPVVFYGGEVEAFENHIISIQTALSNQNFNFTRKTTLQSYNTAFSPDFFLFQRNVLKQDAMKRRKSTTTLALSTQAAQIVQNSSPPVFNLFVIYLVDDINYQPKKSVFTDWIAAFNSDPANPFFSIVIVVSEAVKLNKNSSKPACIDKVRSFYGFSRAFEYKCIFLFSSSNNTITANFAFEVFISKLKESVTIAVDVLLAENEELLKKEWDQRESADWNMVAYLRSYETLMEFYKAIKIHQAVHESYLELKAYVEQVVLNYRNGALIPWVKMLLAEQPRWPGLTLNESVIIRNRDLILADKQKLTFLDLQNLIFSNIFFQYLRDASSIVQLFCATLDFITFTRVVLLTVLVPDKCTSVHAVDCWSFVTALSVLLYCKNEANVNLFDFPALTVNLWEVARTALENLGKAVGLYSKEKQTTEQIQTGLDIMAGVEQSDDCVASLQLRRALSSKSNFDEKFEELITMAISTCKHKGWKRSASWKTTQLADFLAANGRYDLAAKHYMDSLTIYAQEQWPQVEIAIRSRVYHCQLQDKSAPPIDPVNLLASMLINNSDRKRDDTNKRDGRRMSAAVSTLSVKSEAPTACTFLSKVGMRVRGFTAVTDESSGAVVSSSEEKDGADMKFFDLVIESLFPSELQGVNFKWYYSALDEEYRLGYIRSSNFRFMRPEQVAEKSQQSTKPESNQNSSHGASTAANVIDNKLVIGGEDVFSIKPGKHKYRVAGVFRTAGLYQFKKINCIYGSVNMELFPQSSIDFHITNIAPKVSFSETSKPIFSHVNSNVQVVVDRSEWPTNILFKLETCSCATATVDILSRPAILSGSGEADDDKVKELVVELKIFTSILTDFHAVSFHWVVTPSKLSLTSSCQIPSKRPLTIVPELLPAIQPPILLLTARNGSNATLELINVEFQHRVNSKSDWEKIELNGPVQSSPVMILSLCKACWSSAPSSLPIGSELRLSCQYKTDHYTQQPVSWRSFNKARLAHNRSFRSLLPVH